ncbi:MAG: response regulator transcription factor [Verrucomicrobia bacterium]|nr:response regulator transcription factor [Verrucomicrobiota bacterium]
MTASAIRPIRILLVDDSELVRRGIKSALAAESDPPMQVVGEAAGVAEAVAAALKLKPDIILLDIRLPDGSGFDACRQIVPQLPGTRVVILTSHSNDSLVYEAVTSGAQGYLMKEIDHDGFVQAIRNVAAGRSILDPQVTARVLRLIRGEQPEGHAELATLSPQERRVVALVAAGRTNKEIAGELSLSENTVKNYLSNAFEKLKIKRRSQAATIYVQQGTAAPQHP